MSEKVPEEEFTLKKLLFNENGKFCLPCTLYKSFQYISGTNPTVNTPATATPDLPVIETAPIQQSATAVASPASDLIPGSRTYMKEDPPDVNKVGASSWTFLHTMAAKYPDQPTAAQQGDMTEFLNIFSRVYPCFWCAKDFEKYITENAPRVQSKEELSLWMCQAHNKVNKKLGKAQFNCDFWKQRWKDGWEDEQQ